MDKQTIDKWRQRASNFYSYGNDEKSLKYCNKVFDGLPEAEMTNNEKADFYFGLLRLYHNLELTDKAISCMKECIMHNPKLVFERKYWRRCEQLYNELEAADIDNSTKADAFVELGETYHKFNYKMWMVSCFANAHRLWPESKALETAEKYLGLNEEYLFKTEARLAPLNKNTLLTDIIVSNRSENYQNTVKHIQNLIDANPNHAQNTDHYYNMSVAYSNMGEKEKQIVALQKSVELDSCNYDALCHLGWFQFVAGKTGEAEKTLLKALNALDVANKPHKPTKSYILVFKPHYGIYQRIDTSERAKSLLATANLNLGHICFVSDDLLQAKKYYANSIEITGEEMFFNEFQNDYTILVEKGVAEKEFQEMKQLLHGKK